MRRRHWSSEERPFLPKRSSSWLEGPPLSGGPFCEDKSGSKWHLTLGSQRHAGDDAYADDWNYGSGNQDIGKTLLSACSGSVVFAGVGDETGYGNQVVVRSDESPSFVVRYAHMDRVDVGVGDKVEHGTPIGTVGGSGTPSPGSRSARRSALGSSSAPQRRSPSSPAATRVAWAKNTRSTAARTGTRAAISGPTSLGRSAPGSRAVEGTRRCSRGPRGPPPGRRAARAGTSPPPRASCERRR